MRTQKKNIFKTVGMIALTLFLVSCGKDNKSGGNNGWNGYLNGVNLPQNSSQYVNTIIQQQEQACRQSLNGMVRDYTVPVNAMGQGIAIGITSGGSVAILDAATRTLRLRLCDDPRNPFAGQPFIAGVTTHNYLIHGQCQGLSILNGVVAAINTQYGQMYGFVFRNPFQMMNNNCGYQFGQTYPNGPYQQPPYQYNGWY